MLEEAVISTVERSAEGSSTNLVILSVRSDLLFRDVKSVEYNIIVHLSGTCTEQERNQTQREIVSKGNPSLKNIPCK